MNIRTDTIGIAVKISGIVQGVGFRPFIHRQVTDFSLRGWVRNTFDGVELNLEGNADAVHAFASLLQHADTDFWPPAARIDSVEIEENSVAEESSVDEANLAVEENSMAEEYSVAEANFAVEDDSMFEENSVAEGDACSGKNAGANQAAKSEKFPDFRILDSERSGKLRNTLISPDIGICSECRKELLDTADRRYRYPFINCTNCGPRFTIIRDVPYDRANTSMSGFVMCPDCAAEYADIRDRRYHAQPDCCADCGPELEFVRETAAGFVRTRGNEASIRAALEMLAAGRIVAVKGLGGFHLCCRADLPEAVRELRKRKHRDGKPFAVMCSDISEARRFARISEAEVRLLESRERPIVLLKKRRPDPSAVMHDFGINTHRSGMTFAEKRCNDSGPHEELSASDNDHASVLDAVSEISDNNRIGIMLPYTPLHELLFADNGPYALRALVMTSANLSDCPIISDNDEALSELLLTPGETLHKSLSDDKDNPSNAVADGVLIHNREIVNKCDDSVVWEFDGNAYFARRSRGYVPAPIRINSLRSDPEVGFAQDPEQVSEFDSMSDLNRGLRLNAKPASEGYVKPVQILACGAELKASFAMNRGEYVFISQHIGDLKNIETYEHYESQMKHFENLFDIRPEIAACDLHPDYMSSAFAEETGLPVVKVQHHHAHMAACMADNGLPEKYALQNDSVCSGMQNEAATDKCLSDSTVRKDFPTVRSNYLGIIWDGTGLGTDGTIWGSEFLVGGYASFEWAGSIRPIRLPGGDRCMQETWRTACALMSDAGLEESIIRRAMDTGEASEHDSLHRVMLQLSANVNCPVSSGMGRLFDGVAAILGICREAEYEGQGAILLQAAAEDWLEDHYATEAFRADTEAFKADNDENAGASLAFGKNLAAAPAFPYSIEEDEAGVLRFDWRPMVREIAAELGLIQSGSDNINLKHTASEDTASEDNDSKHCPVRQSDLTGYLSLRFLNTLCVFALDMCRRIVEAEADRIKVQMYGEASKSDAYQCTDRKACMTLHGSDSEIDGVLLSGGTFQNLYLLRNIRALLEEAGFKVYTHRQVSCNDEGISLGQLMVARHRL